MGTPRGFSCRYSLGAGPRLVAPIAWVRIPVAAFFILDFVERTNPAFTPSTPRSPPLPTHPGTTRRFASRLSYGHTTMKAPHPIRTAKLSIVGPDQYYSWGQCGNLGCCRALLYFLDFKRWCGWGSNPDAMLSSFGHTTMKAPHPIRTAKLSIVGPDQYCSWG